ncbi:MAG: DUF5615 family PIN-like protein [Planctomycetota bacterium]|jgi:predicted nuclease of predicted toxin-antitoxin system|nr:DUF5615 family PIN-like protein [Planctomycetota bacterium]MDA1213041.1 DUF5615 family PIN-like protein [Planctomycetota bacterium]
MRFLVDECTGSVVARWLESQSYEVFSVYDDARGISDDEVLYKAKTEDWILITNDKDFGEKIYRESKPHVGVIFLRLHDERVQNKIDALKKFLAQHTKNIAGQFVVVSESTVRFAKPR